MIWTAVKFIGALGISAFLIYMADYRFERAEYVFAALDLFFGAVWMFIAHGLFRKLDEALSE